MKQIRPKKPRKRASSRPQKRSPKASPPRAGDQAGGDAAESTPDAPPPVGPLPSMTAQAGIIAAYEGPAAAVDAQGQFGGTAPVSTSSALPPANSAHTPPQSPGPEPQGRISAAPETAPPSPITDLTVQLNPSEADLEGVSDTPVPRGQSPADIDVPIELAPRPMPPVLSKVALA